MSEFTAVEFGALREDISELRAAMTKVADALERLARLEERHANSASAIQRGFEEITKVNMRVDVHDTRLKTLEISQPAAKKSAVWVERIAYGAIVVVAMAVMKKIGLM
jgi:hypothetical protein